MSRADINQRITDRIIADLEQAMVGLGSGAEPTQTPMG